MYTILVPHDNSKNADQALLFALHLSENKPVKVVVFQAGEILILTSTPHDVYLELYPKKIQEKLDDLKEHVKKISHGLNLPNLELAYEWIDSSDFQEVLEASVIKYNADLIVMGTKGASGISKVLMGSNTVKTIAKANVPVLAIPENMAIKDIKSVAYASDLQSIKSEIGKLVKITNHFNWTINIFHTFPNYPQWADPSQENIDYLLSELNELYKEQSFTIELINTENDNETIKGIAAYITRFKPEVLVMFPSKPTFFDKLMGTSNTDAIAFHSSIPLLVIK